MPLQRALRTVAACVLFGCGAGAIEEVAGGADVTDGGASSSGSTNESSGSSGESDASSESSGAAQTSSSESTGADDAVALVRVAAGIVDDAELVETVPVSRSEDQAQRRIVLQLEPAQLPDLQPGDRLLTAAELQVTTRCDVGQTAPGCDYDPEIAAQLILTGDATSTDPTGTGSLAVSAVQQQTCTKGEHHCLFVFRPADAATVLADAPCLAAGECRIHLVLWTWDPEARPDGVDRLIVGENEGDYLANGIVGSDKARLVAVRERGAIDDHVRTTETTGTGMLQVPTDASATLVQSHLLTAEGARAGEQFVVEAEFVTQVESRARVSSKLFVTTDAAATGGPAPAGIEPQEIGEHNGINCTPSTSPCTTRKVAVFRVAQDLTGPVRVNLVVHGAVPGGGTTQITVRRDESWIRATRYAAALDG